MRFLPPYMFYVLLVLPISAISHNVTSSDTATSQQSPQAVLQATMHQDHSAMNISGQLQRVDGSSRTKVLNSEDINKIFHQILDKANKDFVDLEDAILTLTFILAFITLAATIGGTWISFKLNQKNEVLFEEAQELNKKINETIEEKIEIAVGLGVNDYINKYSRKFNQHATQKLDRIQQNLSDALVEVEVAVASCNIVDIKFRLALRQAFLGLLSRDSIKISDSIVRLERMQFRILGSTLLENFLEVNPDLQKALNDDFTLKEKFNAIKNKFDNFSVGNE